MSIHPPTLMLATVIVTAALVLLVLSMRVGLGKGARGVRTWLVGDVLVLLAQGVSVLVTAAVDKALPPMTVTSGMIMAGIALHVLGIHRHRHAASARDGLLLCIAPLPGVAIAVASLAMSSLAARSLLFSVGLSALISYNLVKNLWPERRFLGVRMMMGIQALALVANAGLLVTALNSSSAAAHGTEVGMLFSLVMPLLTTTSFMLWLQEELRESLQGMAQTDALTGVYNRHGLLPLIELELSRARRTGHPMALAICDIDRFKSVNDRWGHAAGDRVLRQFAQTLKGHVRATDLVGRWGGEEFVVVFPDTDADGAAAVLHRMRGRPEGTALDELGRLTFSAGIASSADIGGVPSAEALIAQADTRLYLAKVARDCVVYTEKSECRAAEAVSGERATALG
jgi:diguanylate cyclase (GGDEF)-like protein